MGWKVLFQWTGLEYEAPKPSLETQGVDRQEKSSSDTGIHGVSFGTCTRGEPLGSYTQLHLCELSFLLNPAFTCRSAVCTLCRVYRCTTLPDIFSLTRPPTVFEKIAKLSYVTHQIYMWPRASTQRENLNSKTILHGLEFRFSQTCLSKLRTSKQTKQKPHLTFVYIDYHYKTWLIISNWILALNHTGLPQNENMNEWMNELGYIWT